MTPLETVTAWMARAGLGPRVPVMLVGIDSPDERFTGLASVQEGKVASILFDTIEDEGSGLSVMFDETGAGHLPETTELAKAEWREDAQLRRVVVSITVGLQSHEYVVVPLRPLDTLT